MVERVAEVTNCVLGYVFSAITCWDDAKLKVRKRQDAGQKRVGDVLPL
jgi:hypothetical protein